MMIDDVSLSIIGCDGLQNQLSSQVFEFVSRYWYVDSKELHESTTLFGDLGMDGDDGQLLLASFAETFHVDMSDYRPSDYFGPEAGPTPWTFFVLPFRLLYFRDVHKAADVTPITIGDLIQAARRGKWEAKVPNSRK